MFGRACPEQEGCRTHGRMLRGGVMTSVCALIVGRCRRRITPRLGQRLGLGLGALRVAHMAPSLAQSGARGLFESRPSRGVGAARVSRALEMRMGGKPAVSWDKALKIELSIHISPGPDSLNCQG